MGKEIGGCGLCNQGQIVTAQEEQGRTREEELPGFGMGRNALQESKGIAYPIRGMRRQSGWVK